ncbi:PTS sugar transporter subunit IIA [Mycoplasma elephantis]|uniref:PTS sugar transporter subunit IIA n=1 Tax=Mycoplasma elephantis TaxID=114882 RepID=UPI0004812605|nr:PTS glucose transporter subunit IIA [Mycoplasma elephantis]
MILKEFLNLFKAKKKIYSPCDGDVLPLKSLNDNVFCEGHLGEGVIIEPNENDVTICSPISGKIAAINDTNHAIVIESKNVNILLHIGSKTSILKGQGFKLLVNKNQQISKKNPILCVDFKYLKSHLDFSGVIMVVIPESRYNKVSSIKYGKITNNSLVFKASK